MKYLPGADEDELAVGLQQTEVILAASVAMETHGIALTCVAYIQKN